METSSFLERWTKRAFGSVLFLGYIPGAPGTIGSLVIVALLWFFRQQLAPYFVPQYFVYFWVVAFVLITASIYFANNAREHFGDADPKQYILDECAGQFITFFLIPFSWKTLILGFLLFRFFDIVKPFPVHKFEELDEGLGVTMDDVAAGVMANLSMLALLGVYHGIRAVL